MTAARITCGDVCGWGCMGVKWNCKAAAQHVRNDVDKIFRKAGADQRGDPLKMVAVSKCLSV